MRTLPVTPGRRFLSHGWLALAVLTFAACSDTGARGSVSTSTGGKTATGGSPATGGIAATGGTPATGGNPTVGGVLATGGVSRTGGTTPTADAGPDTRADAIVTTGGVGTGGAVATGGTVGTGGIRLDGGIDTRRDTGITDSAILPDGAPHPDGATGGAPACTVPAANTYKLITAVGGGGSSYKESDHFAVFGASAPDATLNFLEAAHQCFVEEWCWRSPGLSITESSGTPYKLNVYTKSLSGAAGVMQYDATRGLAYLEVVPASIGSAEVVVHELGHALTLAEKGWVDQGRTGLWWEAVANFVADSFQTSPFCAKARADHQIAAGRTLIDLNATIGNSFNIIVVSGNHYEAWPFLAYLTYNPDGYTGLGQMALPTMFRTHKRNNETPLHVLERMTAPIKVQTIIGRYWARMAFVDIGHPTAQATFLAGRARLNYANLAAAGTGLYKPLPARQPKYAGANLIPLKVSGEGTVAVQITNLGNGQSDSDFTATIALRATSGGATRYVDLPAGTGTATLAAGEEAALVVANTPKALYLYDPSNVGANDPANAGLNYQVQLTGATPAN